MTGSEGALVSVIMPTYNHGRYIAEAIDSVIAQSYSNWELIVVNNYSSDDTCTIVSSYRDFRISISNFRNSGIVARSRNYGLALARGAYIAFLDSDDIWLPRKLEFQLSVLTAKPEIDGVSSAIVLFPGEVRAPMLPGFSRRLTYNEMLSRNEVFSSSVILRKETVDSTGRMDESPSLTAVEDYDYWLRILRKKDRCLYFLDKVLVRYRVSAHNLSGMGGPRSTAVELNRYRSLFSNMESRSITNIVLAFRWIALLMNNTLAKNARSRVPALRMFLAAANRFLYVLERFCLNLLLISARIGRA